MLKHLYDKKPAEEYDFILYNLEQIVRYPYHLYPNKDSKRGDIAFVKLIHEKKYFCAIEKGKNVSLSASIFG